MRFLFVDSNYPGFLDDIYRSEPGLEAEPYSLQTGKIKDGLFGEAQFQAAALRNLGHDAEVLITNAHAAQAAWAREHGLASRSSRRAWTIRRRRNLIPWPMRSARQTDWEIVIAQARTYGADVIYVEIMDSVPADVARELTALAPISIAQIAAPVPAGAFIGYRLLISSIPAFVDQFRHAGVRAEYVPLAFEPNVLNEIPVQKRDLQVSFVGSVGPSHQQRTSVLATVAKDAGIDIWTAEPGILRRSENATLHGPVFGRAMYEVLARSSLTINAHAPWAGADANNLRLYEATGMGALLVTESRRNLKGLFEVGSEVVAYETPDRAAEVVRYFREHPEEAAEIASAGQARTLRDHTWAKRMDHLLDLITD